MSRDLVPAKPTKLREWMAQPEVHAEIAAAVGDTMDPSQFIAHMLTALQDPEIRQCSDASKFTAVHECAAMALLPTLDQVRLIPYKDMVKAMPQWQGYKAVMERHPDILEVTGYLVHRDDELSYTNGQLHHAYDPLDPAREINSAKDIKGGYCKITYRDGRPPKYHFVAVRHIEKARKCAQTQKIWTAWYEQMALKTLYRDCFARRAVPVDPVAQSRIQEILRRDDAALGNDPCRISSDAHLSHAEQARELRQAQQPEKPPQAAEGEQGEPPAEDPVQAIKEHLDRELEQRRGEQMEALEEEKADLQRQAEADQAGALADDPALDAYLKALKGAKTLAGVDRVVTNFTEQMPHAAPEELKEYGEARKAEIRAAKEEAAKKAGKLPGME